VVVCRWTQEQRLSLLAKGMEAVTKKTADTYATYARKWKVGVWMDQQWVWVDFAMRSRDGQLVP
jgi:hypothetical protein